MLNRLQIPVVSKLHPTLRISIEGLGSIAPSEGETAIYISRFGQNWETVKYLAQGIGEGFASFYLDTLFLSQLSGVYTARFIYRGTQIGHIDFEYQKDNVCLVASAN